MNLVTPFSPNKAIKIWHHRSPCVVHEIVPAIDRTHASLRHPHRLSGDMNGGMMCMREREGEEGWEREREMWEREREREREHLAVITNSTRIQVKSEKHLRGGVVKAKDDLDHDSANGWNEGEYAILGCDDRDILLIWWLSDLCGWDLPGLLENGNSLSLSLSLFLFFSLSLIYISFSLSSQYLLTYIPIYVPHCLSISVLLSPCYTNIWNHLHFSPASSGKRHPSPCKGEYEPTGSESLQHGGPSNPAQPSPAQAHCLHISGRNM